ncbi:hypothetical protein ENUP19_0136G0007 [Entamoeba nuttalli]|uniref:Uncharacterized protein n=2 Tax=Entamoeba nuttalli TaxID=412467 RepID=K2G3W2_ENTNP|nr:hypothetical protein ENU1_213180 [Entamoeba nuttalli P19]EKE36981.1 hypothetical protein ENU1_213180 [Entamoeba nuttalli P19]|eukprot:XP_008860684.1 hypothetical protein ENU1_213180 [Entamoeba nuttalli P19]
METDQLDQPTYPLDSSISKLLQYLLSQYSERPFGSVNESLTMGQFRGELQKVCDIVEEEPFKICPYITRHKWLFISLYFVGIMVCGILSPLATIIVSLIGTILYWLIYDIQFSFLDFVLPGKQSLNLFGVINGSLHEEDIPKRTLLFVSHISDIKKDSGIIYHLTGILVHFSLYILTLFILIGFIIGEVYNNFVLIPIASIVSTIILFFSMSMYIEGKKNKVSGLATSLCLMNLSQKLKEDNSPVLENYSVIFLITTSIGERHEGIRAFLKRHKKDERFNPKNTTIICLDELDDSETISCYSKEGFLFKKYDQSLIDLIKDASESEGIAVQCVTNRIHQPFTFASEFSGKYSRVVPLTAKCRSVKRKFREEKEKNTKQDGSVICVHDDQMKCVNNCSILLLKVCKLLDSSINPTILNKHDSLNTFSMHQGTMNQLDDVPIEL